ncbi:UDP-N-acetylmuramoyl-L-alanyl-D-glutamate--2,6-diaminopimelate ligase [Acutalibacter caecimuris]|uniref:UDP-N-acetylmuramoyl-L-alanyl-D-glutamate--2, 6-diaminopimelate ligase n=1 Tax=Acutalibacter caecimuris TaxID=3093657 RepID=UPI002AC95D02|nr:UDP-N-acetylmuramoyl-L-alanyl-D-glutamate--2,6-diaminopimelate ligase [Acutalibacter sp. M00118]
MQLSQLLAPLGVPCPEDREITGIVYDSRQAVPGCAFVCIKGSAVDGHNFAAKAAKAGAAAVIAQQPVEVPGVPVVQVEDTKKALALMSAAFFGDPARHGLQVIGITGTKGKTTTAYMVRAILEAAGHKTGAMGTIGVAVGEEVTPLDNTTPISYEVQRHLRRMLDAGCEYCVMEVSSIGLKDDRVYGVPFAVGVFTNFSEDHIGGVEHQDMAEYLACKAMLFSLCKVGVVNADDPAVEKLLEGSTCQVYRYGMGAGVAIRGEGCHHLNRPGLLGVAFHVAGDLDFTAQVGIPGKFNAYNALAAIACCHRLGIPVAAMQEGLRTVKVKGRVEPVPVPGNYTLLLDYAHNALSMESLLTTLREYAPKRLVCLFGAGGNRPRVRRYEMGEASGRLADLSVITADNSRFENVLDIIQDIKTGMEKTDGQYIEIPDRREAIRWCLRNAQDGDIIVLAGKGHEDYQEIEGVKHPFDERVVIREILGSL